MEGRSLSLQKRRDRRSIIFTHKSKESKNPVKEKRSSSLEKSSIKARQSVGLRRDRRSIIATSGDEEVKTYSGEEIGDRGGKKNENLVKEKRFLSLEKNPIETVMIVAKRRRDFEYLSGIIHAFCGGSYAPNRVAGGKEQRYIIRGSGEGGGEKLSGVYAVVVLGESLRNWMGHATLTLEYLRCDSLKRQTLRVPLDARDVADDRQIFILLDPSPKNKRKFLAWKVTLDDGERATQYTRASLCWKIFVKN
jgi:hypothetical protein